MLHLIRRQDIIGVIAKDMVKKDKPDKSNPHRGHRARMRERYKKQGASGLEKHELLEMILYSCNSRANTNPIAHRLLEKFGGISGVLNADISQLTKIEGVGEETAIRLKTYLDVHRLLIEESQGARKKIKTYADAERYTAARLMGGVREEFMVICEDNGYNILGERKWQGGGGSVNVSVREVVEYALATGGSAVIIAHSHAGGAASPSAEDKKFTKALYGALKSVDITLMEHIIHGEGKTYSFGKNGEIASYREEYQTRYGGVAAETPTLV